MNQGYIKIYRKFKENSFYRNSEAVHLWLHLLFSASFENNTFYYKNTKIELKKGQLITGRKKLSQETGINESSIFRLLKLFENEHQIEQQKTNKYSIITIVSYDKYNQDEQQNEQQMNNKRTTNEQQMNTTKELKELKEIYSSKKKFLPPTLEEIKNYCIERKNNVDPQRFFDYYTVSNWKDKDGKAVKNWKQKLISWERKTEKAPPVQPKKWNPYYNVYAEDEYQRRQYGY